MSVQRRPKTGKEQHGRVKWIGRFRDHAGKERSRSFDRERDAKAWVEDQRRALRLGEWVDPARGAVTVQELGVAWEQQAGNPGTRTVRMDMVKNLGDLGGMQVGAVRAPHVRSWVGTLQSGRPWRGGTPLSAASVASYLGQLKAMLSQAVGDGVIPRNPAATVRAPRPVSSVTWADIPTVGEVRAMIDAARAGVPRHVDSEGRARWMLADEDLALALHVAAATGMRPGEVCGLTWQAVDFERGLISVVAQAGKNVGDGLRELKTREKGRRVLSVDDETMRLLAEHRKRRAGSERVFHTRGGGPLVVYTLSAGVKRLRRILGLGEGITAKSFRHFHATMLLRQGVALKTVQARLGHASATMTLNVYAHFMPQDDSAAAAAVGVVLSGEENLRDGRRGLRAVGGVDAG